MAHLVNVLIPLSTMWGYMFIYNLSVIVIFFTLFQFNSTANLTTSTLNNLGPSSLFSKIIMILLFSMAGVPPFWGFFSKIFLFDLLSSSDFFILFIYFFLLTFLGLYFYIQNVRFLNSSNPGSLSATFDSTLSTTPYYYYFSFTVVFVTIFGFIFIEDLLCVMTWLLV